MKGIKTTCYICGVTCYVYGIPSWYDACTNKEACRQRALQRITELKAKIAEMLPEPIQPPQVEV
jgi:hypothetical protein